jgi:F-type H+-transporting ATPase subunit b
MLNIAQEAAHNPILPIWEEIIVGLIAFGLLVFVLGRKVWPKMEQTFAARVEAIEGGIKRAEERQAEAGRLLEQYKEQLATAETEAARIRDEAHADAVEIRSDMLAKAQEESQRVIAAGKSTLEAERIKLTRELRADLGSLAVDLAARIVGEALADEARQRGTVERFLDELDSGDDRAVAGAGGRTTGGTSAGQGQR